MTYNQLIEELKDENIELIELTFPKGLKGLIKGRKIGIDKNLNTKEKKCILAEEIGHYITNVGDIIDSKNVCNRKQELRARNWALEKLIPLSSLIKASRSGCTNIYELADNLDVTEEFLRETLKYYQRKYGLFAEVGNYCIYFNPLTICKYNY
ncbi:MAG: ImmA/IrrE family metallo-endopeptidase, partial [Tissierellia bacterium]|nr:ImmA/IrrE family metallo-endopeptidase [Tissierellia bacterium]